MHTPYVGYGTAYYIPYTVLGHMLGYMGMLKFGCIEFINKINYSAR